MDESTPVLEIENATVRFGSDAVIDGVNLRLFAGEVHSLMGENGAGKSTVIKAISGVYRLDEGEIRLRGQRRRFSSPVEAQRAGIRTVHQELDLLPNISVAENIWLGREPHRWGRIDWKRMHADTADLLAEIGLDISPTSILGTHPLSVQQLVALARAISAEAEVLVLDEPTSSLDLDEVAELFRVIGALKQRGVAILFVSHFLDQVYEICDRLTVLRDGRYMGEFRTEELLRIDLVKAMLGPDADALEARPRTEQPEDDLGHPIVEARGLTIAGAIHDADVDLYAGEVLGVAGLRGSGRTELARALTGTERMDSGVLRISSHEAPPRNPHDAMGMGVVYSSEDRRGEGIIGGLSVRENIALALQAERGILRRISPAHQRELAASWIEALDIRPADMDRPAGSLSGGNQQKVLLARLLALSPQVLVLDEPTRGIDVGAKVHIQNLVRVLAENALSVVFISAELEEVLHVGDRVAILRNGRVIKTIPARELTVDTLLALVVQPEDQDG